MHVERSIVLKNDRGQSYRGEMAVASDVSSEIAN
jgi:hypothetical protein